MVKWVEFPHTSTGGYSGLYQMHWVKGYHRPNGTMTIDEFEDAMFALHGNLSNATCGPPRSTPIPCALPVAAAAVFAADWW